MPQSLLWLCFSTLLTIAGFAGALPAAAAAMKSQGLSEGVIGIITSFIYVGVLCMAPFQPRLAGRFGSVLTYQLGKLLSALGFAALAISHAAWLWSLATMFIGLGAGLTWPVTDSLVASLAPADKKGAWMGLFQTGMGAAFAGGPFIAAAVVPNQMFVSAAVASILSSLPLIGRRVDVHRDGDGHGSLWSVFAEAPELPILAFIGGFFENGTHTAVTLSALALSWHDSGAISLAGVIGAGAFAAQYPVGRLADRRGADRMIAVTLWIMLGISLLLPLCQPLPATLWLVAFLWGAAGGCLYTLAMTGMARRFSGAKVLAATTLMVMSYTVGGITGPAVAGYAVQVSPLTGPLVLFVIASLLGLNRNRFHRPRARA